MTISQSDLCKIFEELPPIEALKQLEPLAEEGEPLAQFYLGELYGLGDGVPKDEECSFHWYRLSAAQGHAPGLHYVGISLLFGLGCEIDLSKAVSFLEQAARLQYPPAIEAIQNLENHDLTPKFWTPS